MEIPPILSGFDAIKLTDEKGHSYWKARDLAKALGYAGYRNFKPVIGKAMENCKANGKPIVQHFIGFHEMTELPSGLFGEVENLKLTRYACLLIATNANKRKPNVVQAQSYFSGNTSSPAIYDTRENLHLLLYKTPGKKNGIETIFGDNTCWLSKKEMAGLFSVNVSTIRRHLEQVF
ncbi:MAG TPA: BRO family protein, partial [Paludibacter sp.]|nr:BRO family protein [Paludibacter sp.]